MHSDEEQNNHWRNDPDNWVLGVFYFNKNDKRLLLPKRNPAFGITINFANPQTYLFIAAFILLIGILTRM
jgi:uncharacterized membrane protein